MPMRRPSTQANADAADPRQPGGARRKALAAGTADGGGAFGLKQGGSRVLITTRLERCWRTTSSYTTKDSNICRYLELQGLAAGRRARLVPRADGGCRPSPRVPLPEREKHWKNLFAEVSVSSTARSACSARQLRTCTHRRTGRAAGGAAADRAWRPLLASLNLSLERLDPQSTQSLPHLACYREGLWRTS